MLQWKYRASDEKPAEPKSDSSSSNKPDIQVADNHIYFYSDVNTGKCLALIKTIREMDAKLRCERSTRDLPAAYPETPIWLHIESPGGALFTAFGIAEQIQRIKTPVYSVVEGYAASAATILSNACRKRFIVPSAFMMVHQLSSFHWGKYEEFKDEMKLLDMAMERLIAFYCQRTKITEEKLREYLKRDTWFNAEECLEVGLVDDILA